MSPRPLVTAAVALAAAAIASAPTPAAAERHASVGPYAELGLGAAGFLGATREHAAIGPQAALRVGTDVFSFLSVGGRLELGNHEATVPPPPEDQFVQLYQLAADARLSGRYRAVAVFVDGGLGLALLSTNVLEKVGVTDPDESLSPLFTVGGGLEYQLMNRHYAFGLAGQWSLLPAFDATQTVAGRLYLRYTY